MFVLYNVLYVMTILDGWQVLAGRGAWCDCRDLSVNALSGAVHIYW